MNPNSKPLSLLTPLNKSPNPSFPLTPSTTNPQSRKYSSRDVDVNITPKNFDSYKSSKQFNTTVPMRRSPQKSPSKRSPLKFELPIHYDEYVTKEEADRKVKELQEWGNKKEIRRFQLVHRARVEERKVLKEKPDIGQASKQIYKELQHKKHLSNNIYQRFQQYEQEKAQRLIDNLIATHLEQTHSVPTLRNLLRSNKSQLVHLLRNYSKEELHKHN